MRNNGGILEVLRRWRPLLALVVLMWLVEVLNLVSNRSLNAFGIVPRTAGGLVGIPVAPFLHGSLSHIMANTAALLVLGGLLSLRGAALFAGMTGLLIALSGAGVWCCARSAAHIGASGLVFGYFGYLLASGWYERTPGAVFLAIVAAALYGGMLWGLLPAGNGVSWEAHVAGLGAGIIAAAWQAQRV